jgi:hypothetical protein
LMQGVDCVVLAVKSVLQTSNQLFFKRCELVESCLVVFLSSTMLIFFLLVSALDREEKVVFVALLDMQTLVAIGVRWSSIVHLVAHILILKVVNSLGVDLSLNSQINAWSLVLGVDRSLDIVDVFFVLFSPHLIVGVEHASVLLHAFLVESFVVKVTFPPIVDIHSKVGVFVGNFYLLSESLFLVCEFLDPVLNHEFL